MPAGGGVGDERVGLKDGEICRLPVATEDQVLVRGAEKWGAGASPGGQVLTTVTVTEGYPANSYECVLADTSGGDVTITLPAPSKDAVVAIVKFLVSNILTISAHDGEDIHIVSTDVVGSSITIPNSSLSHHVFISDGTDWFAISEYVQAFD